MNYHNIEFKMLMKVSIISLTMRTLIIILGASPWMLVLVHSLFGQASLIERGIIIKDNICYQRSDYNFNMHIVAIISYIIIYTAIIIGGFKLKPQVYFAIYALLGGFISFMFASIVTDMLMNCG